MAVSINWGSFLVGVLRIGALLVGVFIRALIFWKLPYQGRTWVFVCSNDILTPSNVLQ